MALDKKLSEIDLILLDAQMTKDVQEFKGKITEKTAPDAKVRADYAEAKLAHRELRRDWRELREWVVAENAATAEKGD